MIVSALDPKTGLWLNVHHQTNVVDAAASVAVALATEEDGVSWLAFLQGVFPRMVLIICPFGGRPERTYL